MAQRGQGIIILSEEARDKGAVHFPLKCFRSTKDEEGEQAWGNA